MDEKEKEKLSVQVKNLWAPFARRLSGLGLGISGKYYTVKAIAPGNDEIGYTMPGNRIFLSNDNDILDTLKTVEERFTFIKGVFLHELMHQIETDFATWEKVRNSIKDAMEQRIFHTIANIIEDPAIEWHARYYMRKEVLKALEFSLGTTYKYKTSSGGIDPSKKSPFGQFMEALIMYGDGGIIKGSLCKEANDVLTKALPIVDKAIEEDNGAKRIYLSKEVFEIARPLWAPEVANAKAMNQLLEELLKRFGKSLAAFGGERIDKNDIKGDGVPNSSSESLSKKRKITFHKISKEEMEKMKEESGNGNLDGDGDIDAYYCDDDEGKDPEDSNSGIQMPSSGKNGKNGRSSSDKGQSSDGDSDGDKKDESSASGNNGKDASKDEGANSEKGDGDSERSDSNSESSESSDNSSKNKRSHSDTYDPEESMYSTPDGSSSGSGSNRDQRLSYDKEGGGSEEHVDAAEENIEDDDSYQLTDEELEAIASDIESMEHEVEITQRESDSINGEDLDLPISIPKYASCKCKNYLDDTQPSEGMVESYNAIVTKYSPQIARLVSQLRRIIMNEAEETGYRNSGKVSVKRLADARMTSRVFSKRVDPANKGDIAVFILVDNSGSMGYHKIEQARNCAIALTEVFVQLKIPIKVMGFSDGEGGYDACHYHFVNWSKSINERIKLLNMRSRNSNFDGYAIRYATKALMKRHEQNKMLIVISDGQPACRFYWGTDGISDTSEAVREAKKTATVVGVAIDADIDVLHTMYGDGFVLANNLDEMFSTIGQKIKKEMKA